jgi:methyltransferase
MLEQSIGAAQIAALLILLQRAVEELYSARNTARLIAGGGREAGRDYYPVVAITHLAWIAAIFLLIPATAPIILPLLVLYLCCRWRYWIIASLGPYWTHRIITLPDAPVVRAGPYKFMRHPNYATTIAETFLLPLVFADAVVAVIFGCVWSAVLYYKILLEDKALLSGARAEGAPTLTTPVRCRKRSTGRAGCSSPRRQHAIGSLDRTSILSPRHQIPQLLHDPFQPPVGVGAAPTDSGAELIAWPLF